MKVYFSRNLLQKRHARCLINEILAQHLFRPNCKEHSLSFRQASLIANWRLTVHCSPHSVHNDWSAQSCAPPVFVLAALKVVLVCFERSLGNQWYRLSLQVKEMALRKVGGLAFWDFIDFIVRTRIPIFVLLRPFIQCKVGGWASGRSLVSPAEVPFSSFFLFFLKLSFYLDR